MKKRNIIVLVVMAVLLVGSLLFADTVTFDKQATDTACNIQGTVYMWNGYHYIPVQGGSVIATLYYNDGTPCQTLPLSIDANGNYSGDFEDKYNNSTYCNKITVEYKHVIYTSSYDGIERIDIYWFKEL